MDMRTRGDRLAARLMRGEAVEGAQELTQVHELLATDDTGAPAPDDRRRGAAALLRDWEKIGVIAFVDTGRRRSIDTRPLVPMAACRPWSGGAARVETLQDEVRRRESEQQRSESKQEVPVLAITPSELAKARPMLQVAGYWPRWAEVWCGTGEVGGEAAGGEVGGENTHMPLERFKLRYGPHFTGKIDSLCKNGKRKKKDGTAPPYAEIFNADGTFSGPEFERIAKARGEWDEGAGGAALQQALAGRVHRVL